MRLHLARTGLVLALTALRALAHPGDEQALAELDALITDAPAQIELRLLRAAHRTEHAEWAGAEADLRTAASLDPDAAPVELAWGRLDFARKRFADACRHFDRALARTPDNAEALILRARARAALGAPEAPHAYADYSAAVRLLAEPSPSLFLERAALPIDPPVALAGLDEGLARLGPVVSLLERALTLELALGRTDAALARLDALIAISERKESLLKRRGDLLASAGRHADAQQTYTAALVALRTLPDWLRATPEIAALDAELARLTRDFSR
ncbi:MAG TPA: hypothetical protein VGD81_12025 [Opitutaceae bacterium]